MDEFLQAIRAFIVEVDTVTGGGVIGLSFGEVLVALLIFLVAAFMRGLVTRIVLNSLYRLTKSTSNKIDDQLVAALHDPLRFMVLVFGLFAATRILTVSDDTAVIFSQLIRSLIAFVIFWTLYRLVEPLSFLLNRLASSLGPEFADDIKGLVVRSLKAAVAAVGLVAVLQEWGFNVTGFVASLGLVGMAVALAAKDTVANLFGSLTIFLDRSFAKGDWIMTPEVEGTVEGIGLRSTRVRTFAKALVTIPNASLANGAITNWSRMTNRRIKMTIGLQYDTSPAQMERILERLRDYLKTNPDIQQDNVTTMVNLHHFNDSSLDIFLYFFTKTTDWAAFMTVQERCLLDFMKIVDEEGAAFAFPSRSVYMENLPDKAAAGDALPRMI